MKYPKTPTQRLLRTLGACWRAKKWVAKQSLTQAWKTCSEPDWMDWIVYQLDNDFCNGLINTNLSCKEWREAVSIEKLLELAAVHGYKPQLKKSCPTTQPNPGISSGESPTATSGQPEASKQNLTT